jgi:hypothetical protein
VSQANINWNVLLLEKEADVAWGTTKAKKEIEMKNMIIKFIPLISQKIRRMNCGMYLYFANLLNYCYFAYSG